MLKIINSAYEKAVSALRKGLFRIFKPGSALGKIIDKAVTKEIISYLIFGLLTTAVNFLVTSLLVVMKFGNDPTGTEFTLVNAIAWCVSVIFAFFTNKLFVFESRSFAPSVFFREFTTFVGARIVTGLIETFLPGLLMEAGLDAKLFGVKGLAAKLAVAVIVVVLNYVFSKLVSFRKGKDAAEKPGDAGKEETDNSSEEE